MNITPPIETLFGPEAIAMLKRLGPVSPKICQIITAPGTTTVILFVPETNTPAVISRWKFEDTKTALAHCEELRRFCKKGNY